MHFCLVIVENINIYNINIFSNFKKKLIKSFRQISVSVFEYNKFAKKNLQF